MRDLLIKDLGWKLFSVFLAVTIWLTVHKINGESPDAVAGSTITFEGLPVVMVSSSSDVRSFSVKPRTVTVAVSGPPEVMSKLQSSQVRPMVNLTDITNAAAFKEADRPVEVSAPSGVTLISITPATVTVAPPPRH